MEGERRQQRDRSWDYRDVGVWGWLAIDWGSFQLRLVETINQIAVNIMNPIEQSRIIAATLILKDYFGDYLLQVYETFEECEKTNDYSKLGSLSALTTFYFGQEIREKDESKLSDAIYYVFEAYRVILTMQKTSEEKDRINAAIKEVRIREQAFMMRFYKEDIEKIKE
uniref:Uncharacterized protein n=1 Tax=Tolypothrix bouteillei VB521301 TaxID=1479485 RepID=A0A0C1MVL9_9CYAN